MWSFPFASWNPTAASLGWTGKSAGGNAEQTAPVSHPLTSLDTCVDEFWKRTVSELSMGLRVGLPARPQVRDASGQLLQLSAWGPFVCPSVPQTQRERRQASTSINTDALCSQAPCSVLSTKCSLSQGLERTHTAALCLLFL